MTLKYFLGVRRPRSPSTVISFNLHKSHEANKRMTLPQMGTLRPVTHKHGTAGVGVPEDVEDHCITHLTRQEPQPMVKRCL